MDGDIIDLKIYIERIRKRKITILAVVLVCVGTAFVFSRLIPPQRTFEAVTFLRPGIVGDKPICNFHEFKKEVFDKKRLSEIFKKLGLPDDFYNDNIGVDRIDKTLFSIAVRDQNLDTAVNLANALAESIIIYYQQRVPDIYQQLKALSSVTATSIVSDARSGSRLIDTRPSVLFNVFDASFLGLIFGMLFCFFIEGPKEKKIVRDTAVR